MKHGPPPAPSLTGSHSTACRVKGSPRNTATMSRLSQANGDDHPDAAGKHLDDAVTLLTAGRNDGAAYLAGYVVECSLKSLILFEHGHAVWSGRGGHDLNALSAEALRLASLPGARTAKYVSFGTPGHSLYTQPGGWTHHLRYRPPGTIPPATAADWLAEATQAFSSIVVAMRLDGVL